MGRRKIAGAFAGILLLCMQTPFFVCGQEVERTFGGTETVRTAPGNIGMLPAEDTALDDAERNAANLSLYATSAVLLDGKSGRVLYGKNADAPMAMASTTKIMTCITVLETGNQEDTLQISSYAASMPKVKLYLKKGETYQVKDLLYSLMLESHNDSAVALAEYIGKKYLPDELQAKETKDFTVEESKQAVAAFAALMNGKAKELGCENTYFITPNGLDAVETITLNNGETVQREHSTTAEELAEMMAYCIGASPKKEMFLQITGTPDYAFSANGRSFSCSNHNAFLNMMSGALSGKTGFTNKAGYCYVGALSCEERTFVVALLACGWPNNKTYKWSDTKELMRYGMENYFYRDFGAEGTAAHENSLQPLQVADGRTGVLGDAAYTSLEVLSGEKSLPGLLLRNDEQVQVEYRLPKSLEAPVERGMEVGKIYYVVNDIIYRTDTIIASQTVEKIDFPWCMQQVWERYVQKRAG